jgi:muramidase (phage lysozyme)
MTPRERCEAALMHREALAFLRVIRAGESSQDESAFTILWGGGHFTAPPWQHPRQEIFRNGITSSAAGAFQFLTKTWDGIARKLDLPDFTPHSQELGALGLIDERNALDDVLAGNLDAAISKCAPVWASLPGSPYGQPTLTLEHCREVYAAWLARDDLMPAAQVDAGAAIPAPDIATQTEPAQSAPAPDLTPSQPSRPTMDPFTIFGLITQFLPGVIAAIGHNSPQALKNAGTVQSITDTIVKSVPGATGPGDAIDKLAGASKEQKAQITAAVLTDPAIASLVEVGGGVAAARRDNIALVAAADHWWKLLLNPVLLVTVLILPLVYLIVWGLMPFLSKVSADVIAQTIGTVIGLALGSICGFWMGQTFQQTRNNQQRATDPGNVMT